MNTQTLEQTRNQLKTMEIKLDDLQLVIVFCNIIFSF